MNPKYAVVWLALIPIAASAQDQGFGNQRKLSFGASSRLANLQPSSIAYLELVDDQVLEIEEIKKTYGQLADELQNSNSLTREEQVPRLVALEKQMNAELLGVLLPDQKELLKGLPAYFEVLRNSLVSSMVYGVIAQQLGLSNTERGAVKQAARDVFKDYKDAQEHAQKRAIARLIESVPGDKQDRFREMLELMGLKGGMLVPNSDFHFNTDQKMFFREPTDPKALPAADDE